MKEDELKDALKCVSEVPPPKDLEEPTYEEYVANLEGVVNGFYSCLLEA